MNIKKLTNEAHENAKSKGFWDEPREKQELLMLMVTEVAEAVEADRKDRYCDMNAFYASLAIEGFEKTYNNTVKGTFEEEMADVCIRIFDYCGQWGIKLGSVTSAMDKELHAWTGIEIKNTAGFLFSITRSVTDMHFGSFPKMKAGEVLGKIVHLCRVKNIDLDKHIELKMKFNKTRPFKHGKKY